MVVWAIVEVDVEMGIVGAERADLRSYYKSKIVAEGIENGGGVCRCGIPF